MSGNPVPTEQFDWLHDPAIVCREQLAVAVYPNTSGGVVIRAERSWDEDSDTYIIVQPECAQSVADAILRSLKMVGEDQAESPPPPAADRPRAGVRNITPEASQPPLIYNGGGSPKGAAG